jgi:hypothetical protein
MTSFRDNPFNDALEVVATLRDRHIEATIAERQRADELTMALRQLIAGGIDLNSLSDASGLPVEQILHRVRSAA